MEIAYDIGGQFVRMTGIQQTVDSLLGALYQLETPHQITAWAPWVWSPEVWQEVAADGKFVWLHSPRRRIDTVGNDFSLSSAPWARRRPALGAVASQVQKRLLNPLKSRTASWRIRRASRRYDVMHSPGGFLPGLPEPYLARRNVASIYDVTSIVEPWTHDAASIALWDQYYRFAQKHCARVITCSENSKRDIVEHLHIPADRVDVTPLAARAATRRVTDPQEAAPALRELGLEGVPFVLYSGTLESRKNLPRLVTAFAQAVQERGSQECCLVLAGGTWHGHDRELHRLAQELGVGGLLVTPGYVSNQQMNALMSSCQVFAYVSVSEGFGMPPLEAMTCGAPVIASNTTSLPEVVGDAGIQVDPMDTEAIAAAIHSLLTDKEENARFRVRSVARAAEFSWERTARLTLQSYEAAVA